jgi:galactokinase|tara:strand:+ start:3055 stop:4236 length:1182 start_codon:yes stop_codon:yes gene_type:complete
VSTAPERVADDFRTAFGRRAPAVVVRAPGRVNVIGDHTDYHEGFALPAAIDRELRLAAAPRTDRTLQVLSTVSDERVEIDLTTLTPTGRNHWHDYVAGTAWALAEAGHDIGGADIAIRSDLPIGAGLSSSAALEMAVARALCALGKIPWNAASISRAARRAENDYVGLGCGIMDQLTVGAGVAGHALLLDCRSLAVEPIALPSDLAIVVMDTGVRRSLAATEYDVRRAACEAALDAVRRRCAGVRTLRDVDASQLEAIRGDLDAADREAAYRRAAHVIAENARPAQLATALGTRDYAEAGRLVDASHASLRDLYEVSCPELDQITALARRTTGCYGARMTGGGFGGSAVALVAAEASEAFAGEVSAAYRAEGPPGGSVFTCRASAGASVLESG